MNRQQTLIQATWLGYLDELISAQLYEVLHQEEFMRMEASWRGIAMLAQSFDPSENIRVELLQCSLQELREECDEHSSLEKHSLYQQLYVNELDMPGGEPFAAMVADWELQDMTRDLEVLKNISAVAARTHCPFLGSIHPHFLSKKNILEIMELEDIQHTFARAEFMPWHSFRESEGAHFVGLTLVRILMRQPWDSRADLETPFDYLEELQSLRHDELLWGNSVYAYARNLVSNFRKTGWSLPLGNEPESGEVTDLPKMPFGNNRLGCRMSMEALIPQTRAQEFAQQGLLPLCFDVNRGRPCFGVDSSLQGSSLSQRFLASRVLHYLKVLQRDCIGVVKSAKSLELEWNAWLQNLVTQMENPVAELRAKYPFRRAEVKVVPSTEASEFLQVELTLRPHACAEGQPSVVTKTPIPKARMVA